MNNAPSANMYHLWPLADKIELKRKAKEAADSVFDHMTDKELEIAAHTNIEDYPDDFKRKWLTKIIRLEGILQQAEQVGVNLDEL